MSMDIARDERVRGDTTGTLARGGGCDRREGWAVATQATKVVVHARLRVGTTLDR